MNSGILIGDKLKYYRKLRKITQAELAKGICHKSFISKFESNSIKPNQSTLQQLKVRLSIQDIPLTDCELEDFKNEINEWIMLVKNGFTTKASLQHDKLHKVVYELEDQELLRSFLISALKLYLANNKLDDASNAWEDLLPHEHILSEVELYYFYYYGGAYYATTDDIRASQFFVKAVELDRSLNINDGGLYYSLCNYYLQQDRVVASFFCCEFALKKMQHSEIDLSTHWIKLLYAFNCSILGQSQIAIKTLKKLLLQAEHFNNKLFFYNVYHTLGCVYTGDDLYDLGYKSFMCAFEYCEDGSSLMLNNILHLLYLLKKSKNCKEMSSWLTKGLNMATKIGCNDVYAQLISIKYIDNLKNHEALTYVENIALPLLINLKKLRKVVEYSKILANFYFNKHNFKKAYYYNTMASTYTETIYKGDDVL